MSTVAIAFVRADADESPNIKYSDHTTAYYRAMMVTFGSIRRWNPSLDLALITNDATPPEYAGHFATLGVTERLVPFEHKSPPGFNRAFGPSLYMLDALRSQTISETVTYIDPDVLCIRPLNAMLSACGDAVGALPIDYPPQYDVNGLTRSQAAELHRLLEDATLELPQHYGGECYVVPGQWVATLAKRAEAAWALSLERHERAQSRFTTEEHILNYALRGVPIEPVSPFVRRIWTAARHRTVEGDESALTLWHLPAEKNRGFATLYESAIDAESWFWKSDRVDFVRRAARLTGVAGRQPTRLLRDWVGQALSRIS